MREAIDFDWRAESSIHLFLLCKLWHNFKLLNQNIRIMEHILFDNSTFWFGHTRIFLFSHCWFQVSDALSTESNADHIKGACALVILVSYVYFNEPIWNFFWVRICSNCPCTKQKLILANLHRKIRENIDSSQ